MVTRPLTAAETALARSVFADAVDYSAVRVNEGQYMPFQPAGTAMAPDGNLYMYGCYLEDYAAGTLSQQAHFIHEMTHVWQYQNRVLDPVSAALELNLRHAFNYAAAYNYTLDTKKDLTAYNMEQQATIVQDYFLLKNSAGAYETGCCKTAEDLAARMAAYEKILEKFHADPAYARRTEFPRSLLRPKGHKP